MSGEVNLDFDLTFGEPEEPKTVVAAEPSSLDALDDLFSGMGNDDAPALVLNDVLATTPEAPVALEALVGDESEDEGTIELNVAASINIELVDEVPTEAPVVETTEAAKRTRVPKREYVIEEVDALPTKEKKVRQVSIPEARWPWTKLLIPDNKVRTIRLDPDEIKALKAAKNRAFATYVETETWDLLRMHQTRGGVLFVDDATLQAVDVDPSTLTSIKDRVTMVVGTGTNEGTVYFQVTPRD